MKTHHLNMVTESQLWNYEKHPKQCVPDIKNVDKIISDARHIELVPFTHDTLFSLNFLLEKGICALVHSRTNIQTRLTIMKHQKHQIITLLISQQ